ncbi:MAG TPA: hypothetical protein VML53_05845 [Thermoplasmata archaeon]|nr:hypothetical protein [Thermoplasmata archaeon]
MAPAERPDPVRATMIAVLQQLNRVESMHEGRERDQALGLPDLERILHRFWATDTGEARLAQVLGLLVHNGLVRAHAHAPPPARGHPAPRHTGPAQYRITAEGKQFLVDALAKSERIA